LEPKQFDDLSISKGLKKTLSENGFSKMKTIQSQAIPHLLAGRNLLGASPTGSGKTLAFLIPAIELLTYSRARPSHGTFVIVLSPSHELALQTFNVASTLMKSLSPNVGAVVGGSNTYKNEAYQLSKTQYNLLVATPGRLRQHLEAGNITLSFFQFLIIDEADRMLENGFADDLFQIFKALGTPKQTALFSATLTKDVEGLLSVNISSPPVFCCPVQANVVSTLEHCYAIVPQQDRLAILCSILKQLTGKRVVVFVNSRKEVEFISRIFNALDIDNEPLHGDLPQEERSLAFVKFNRSERNVLIATNVASRGLDFSDVHWSISFGPPDRVKDYIHRAGRTARNDRFGQSLLLVTPNESSFIKNIQKASIPIKKILLTMRDIKDKKDLIQNAMKQTITFIELAEEAYTGFVNSYKARPPSEGISIEDIDLDEVRVSFGLPPEGKSSRKVE